MKNPKCPVWYYRLGSLGMPITYHHANAISTADEMKLQRNNRHIPIKAKPSFGYADRHVLVRSQICDLKISAQ
jgi:hypothetical protein